MSARKINRAEIVDDNFLRHLDALAEGAQPIARDDTSLADRDLLALFDSQLQSRQMDLMARIKRQENKVFYTIGSSGHEGNAMVARATRHTDPAFLHYRSGAFMAERSRQVAGIDFIHDTALSFAAAADDPASGGRHKVWGSKPLWVLPQTSTIASHLPKAVGTALAIAHAKACDWPLPVPRDSIVVCSFGDASANHATAQTAFNAAAWAAHQQLPVPIVFVCEDNGLGISVRTPGGWIERRFSQHPGLHYRAADGLNLAAGMGAVQSAVDHCRQRRVPVFLHLKVCRLMGHAGTDFEIEYRDRTELEACEAQDPLLRSAELVLGRNLMGLDELRERYQTLHRACLAAADRADGEAKLTDLNSVSRSLAPYSPAAVKREAERTDYAEARQTVFARLPEDEEAKHLAILINRGLKDLMAKYPELVMFGEDVAQKGGVYTVTRGLHQAFGSRRIFNTLLDETTILGLAQGYAAMGMLPMPEIQYLAYFHNACDQIRGEACSLQYFSDDQYRNPMVMRIPGLGYQKGFGGHFHNDNSITALRDIPGLVIGCPSRGDDAVGMLRTLTALARVDGRVAAFIEPIALYMTKDLFDANDGGWLFNFPPPGQSVEFGAPRYYGDDDAELLIISYGNGIPMSLRAAREIEQSRQIRSRVMDLRWLLPLNRQAIRDAAASAHAVVIVDEGRDSGGVGEGIITALVEAGLGDKPIARVRGADCYTPLGAAAGLVLPDEQQIVQAVNGLLSRPA